MDIVVHKYGGSSLATLEQAHRIARQIAAVHRCGQPIVTVVSARGGTTDELLRLAADAAATSPARPLREVDQLLATGETASAALMAICLHQLGVPAVSLTGAQAGIVATGRYGEGMIEGIRTERIRRLLSAGTTVVVAGFQGTNADGDMATLGRGGSDTTAVALAVELQARRCEIYTDVDGVYTTDPRVLPAARVLPVVDPSVMAEMAFAGAKVLHSRSVELAAMGGIQLRVRSSFTGRPGTVIPRGGDPMTVLETRGVVVAVTSDTDVARVLVHAPGNASAASGELAVEVLDLLANHGAPVDLVGRNGPYEEELRMGFTVRRSDITEIEPALRETVARFGGGVLVQKDVGKVSVIGMGLLSRPRYGARMLAALSRAGITTSWISTSQLRASAVVPIARVQEAIELLHHEFELHRDPEPTDHARDLDAVVAA